MSSKWKQKNSSQFNENITIDAKHNEMMCYFDEQQKSIPKLRVDLKNFIDIYKSSRDNAKRNQTDYIIERNELREEIQNLRKKIKDIESNKELNKYYLKVGALLHNYYENVENSKNNQEKESFETNLLNFERDETVFNDEFDQSNFENENVNVNVSANNISTNSMNIEEDVKKKSVLTFFENRGKEETNEKANEKNSENSYTSTKISDFVKEEAKFKKKNFLDDYLQNIDENYVNKIKIDVKINKCELCDHEMTLYPSEGYQICGECGNQEFILIESDKPSFKDPPLEVCYFSYKRINHFNEWLAQFQAKESTEIPDEVYEKIIAEIKKERITNLEKIDTKKIRQYLKKIKLNKYYDHAAHILYQINGIPPPSMSKELEEKLRLMFKEIQGPFLEVCPKSRKNFLNYSYVLHKFVELLSLDEYKVYFPLLKDREKLHQTDMIWKNICNKLGWQFYKSI